MDTYLIKKMVKCISRMHVIVHVNAMWTGWGHDAKFDQSLQGPKPCSLSLISPPHLTHRKFIVSSNSDNPQITPIVEDIDRRRRRLQEFEVIGRHLPTEANPTPDMYRMTIFAPNETVAKSRFWYFLRGLRKVKKATGEIVSVKTLHEKHPQKVKNFGVWLRYDSRSGTHNMYKEYREMSRVEAVEALYADMAARHRARFRSIHILRVIELEKTDDIKRPYIKQLVTKNLTFPLPHRVTKTATTKLFSAQRPSTFA
ncbi:putative 60S large subunit ribosomal protein [Drechmeria coniospora]|uniref:Putative 60S large subunit ribosomal protein n=1 Tax=Drechmeria coniospora TaxID=98403 RepID=A0A151GFL8_DRECN|nr:putative 60S large subunit ribosomal protein [Drechmeria coniospora]KYK55897.1 putative 60S large subunit ribosomal protein [Drechmeria coniospora]